LKPHVPPARVSKFVTHVQGNFGEIAGIAAADKEGISPCVAEKMIVFI
jgi:hypothetical protein